ncbi:MAG: CNNM domain-containing protein [Desulfatibacillaceae bacterium]
MGRRSGGTIIYTVMWLTVLVAAAGAWAVNLPADTRSGPASDSDVALLALYVLLALVFSFLCSVAEAVLLSVTPTHIAGMEATSPKRAALLRRLKVDNVDRSLAAILTLNTIAHTVGAIGAGAKATDVFGSASFGIFSAVMTLMILFLSEIVPKTLGAVFWRRLTGPVALFVRGLTLVLYPLIVISELLTRLIAKKEGLHVFSRDEFLAMAGLGEQAGGIKESESRIIRNLFRFESLKADDIMTPRTVVVALPRDITVEEASRICETTPFSRLPLYGDGLDDITGFVLKDEILLYKARDQDDVVISDLEREIMTVSDQMPLTGLLDALLDYRQHIAVVAGVYGGTRGVVTLEDVVETLLGLEIVDEMDKVENMQALAREQWERRARAMGMMLEDFGEENEEEPIGEPED